MKLFKKLLIGSTSIALVTPAIAFSFNNSLSTKSKEKDLEINKIYKSSDLKVKDTLIAQTDESSDSDTLKITVTGTRSPKPVDTFPGSIEVLDQNDLSNKSGSSIKEIADEIPGVTVRTVKRSGVNGPSSAGNVNIRGLDLQRILFQIDGIRLPEPYRFGPYTFDQGNYVDFNTLSSVEIIKGPASALYGADALGGLVSYRTLTPSDLLGKDKNTAFEVPLNYDSSNGGLSQSIKFANKLSEKDSVAIVFTNETSSAMNVKADSKFSDDESHSLTNYLINLTRDFDDYTQGTIIYENLSRSSDITSSDANLAAMGTYFSLVSNDDSNRDRVSFEYKYDNPDNDKLFKLFRTKVYNQYARSDDKYSRDSVLRGLRSVRNHDYYFKNESTGGEIEFQSMFNNNKLTYGFDLSEVDTSRFRSTETVATNSTKKEKDTPDTKITRFGAYIQDEVSYGKFDVIAGLRYDTYDLDAKVDEYVSANAAEDVNADKFTPKVATTYNFTDNTTGYVSYAKGFRAPAYYEVNANFTNLASGYKTVSNPELKPETSDSYEVGLRGRFPKFDYNLSAFYNKYDDFIGTFQVVAFRPLLTFKTLNVDEAQISGYEFDFNLYRNENRKGFSLFSKMAYASGDNLTDNVPLDTVNPFEAKYGVKYLTNNNKWEAKLTNTYVAKARVAASTTTYVPEAYTVSDLELLFRPKETFELSAGIYNLFDKAYYNYQDVKGKAIGTSNLTRFRQPELNIKLGATIRF